MRGTRYHETEISTAYANNRAFNYHQRRLTQIQKEQRKPMDNKLKLPKKPGLLQTQADVRQRRRGEHLNLSMDNVAERDENGLENEASECKGAAAKVGTFNKSENINVHKSQNVGYKSVVGPRSYMQKSSYAQRLMSENPFTANQQIKVNFLRASEQKEIEKLEQIQMENKKIMNQLDLISRGKVLAVGPHQINPQKFPKSQSLNFERMKREQQVIDEENDKILKKITHAKSSVPKYNKCAQEQRQILNRISKSKQPNYKDIILNRRRKIQKLEPLQENFPYNSRAHSQILKMQVGNKTQQQATYPNYQPFFQFGLGNDIGKVPRYTDLTNPINIDLVNERSLKNSTQEINELKKQFNQAVDFQLIKSQQVSPRNNDFFSRITSKNNHLRPVLVNNSAGANDSLNEDCVNLVVEGDQKQIDDLDQIQIERPKNEIQAKENL